MIWEEHLEYAPNNGWLGEKRKAVTFFCFYTILWHSRTDLPQSVLRNIPAFSNWHFYPPAIYSTEQTTVLPKSCMEKQNLRSRSTITGSVIQLLQL